MKNIIITALILGLALVTWLYVTTTKKNPTPLITSFEQCVLAGYPVMETYPRQCKTPEGKNYTETTAPKITYTNSSADVIVVDSPLSEGTVGARFSIIGKARGSWFFEASFPIQALDTTGKVIAQSVAQASGDWMTTNFVPFSATIEIPASYVGEITLVLKKDNPSDLRENDASISFSVIKEATTIPLVNMKLYFYSPALDQGPGGAQCTQAGLVSGTRTAPRSITPIQDAVRLLLTSVVSSEESKQGLQSEFPLTGVTLKTASLRNGVLTLTFLDLENKTSGGSCRVNILRNQIEATAMQFPEVKSVIIMPLELFQP